MADSILGTEVRKPSERASVVDIKGEITGACEEVLMDAYSQASTDSTRAVIFNFTGLEYMNSGGIGLLVTLLVRANRQRQKISVFGLTDHYRQIFELTRLDDAIGIYENEQDAVEAAERP